MRRFNTQPPEGGWAGWEWIKNAFRVSTRSRPKAAGPLISAMPGAVFVSTRSRPKAAGAPHVAACVVERVSTRSRPKAAGKTDCFFNQIDKVSTRSRPEAAGAANSRAYGWGPGFNTQPPEGGWQRVSV